MPQTNLWLRVFVGLLVAVVPALVVTFAVLLFGQRLIFGSNVGLVAIAIVIATVGWCATLGIVFARSLAEEFTDLLTLAQRGGGPVPTEGASVQQQMAGLLDERNRQVATLAQQAGRVEIDEPVGVVRSLATAAAELIPHSTWRCAVLVSDDPGLLPPGIYHDSSDERGTEPVGDLEQWASTLEGDEPAAHATGPWGAFIVVRVSAAGTRAVLYAPWEGRVPPTRAELDLLTLLGQHAGTAIEHSLLYARVRSQADELNRLAAVQADFLRGVSHDLQTPLTSIGAMATELKAEKKVPASARNDLDTIVHQADRLRRMVSQLLVASRLEAGALTPQTDVFAVQPMVERTWGALRADRPFSLDVAGEPHLAVADPDRLEQVLWAILDNAVKYSPAGSPIDVTITSGAAEIAVAVRDHGAGMDAQTREHAFDQFYRSGQARKLAPDGSGVGLYAARGLMEAMGGSITIDSELGSGTTMTIRVPAEVAAGE